MTKQKRLLQWVYEYCCLFLTCGNSVETKADICRLIQAEVEKEINRTIRKKEWRGEVYCETKCICCNSQGFRGDVLVTARMNRGHILSDSTDTTYRHWSSNPGPSCSVATGKSELLQKLSGCLLLPTWGYILLQIKGFKGLWMQIFMSRNSPKLQYGWTVPGIFCCPNHWLVDLQGNRKLRDHDR